ncbi:MAG: DnaD domain protein [Oscillospiraceae bacterium]|nr:DnaD domain protein [Oscillospiraceae bacterium]
MKYLLFVTDPKKLKEEHIKLAYAFQLKLLFFAFKSENGIFNSEEAALFLNSNTQDIDDAAQFWINSGIFSVYKNEQIGIFQDFNSVACENKLSEKLVIDSEFNINNFCSENLAKKTLNVDFRKFKKADGGDYLSKRIKESDEISILLNEIQNILGRLLSGADISMVLFLKDTEGLPCDVILMLVQYCTEIGKNSTRYIEKVGVTWAQEGINSIEAVELKIESMSIIKKCWAHLGKIIGSYDRSPTAKEEEAAIRWFETWKMSDELVKVAYDSCVNKKGRYSLAYMNGIIKRWKENGISNVSDIENDNKKRFKRVKPERKPSYDLEEYEESNFSLDA